MSRKLLRGFTAIELIAVLCVLLILAGIVIAVFVSGKDTAVGLRRTNAAAALNGAERSLLDHNSSSAPGLGQDPVSPPADGPGRIAALKAAGFLASLVSTEDVILVQTNGIYYWAPAP